MRDRSSDPYSSAPGEPCTQCGGHGPPWSTNDAWSAGCQSRVATTRSKRPESSNSFTRSAIASPSGTGNAPPGTKSFWKSMIRSASPMVSDHKSVATPEQLREVLLSAEEAKEMDAVGGRVDAAVLVPLYLDQGALHAVFTKRREDLSR